MEGKAILRFARVSAQKARLVADLVRGRDVPQAIEILSFTDKKTAGLMRKLVESAVANVEEGGRRSGDSIDVDTLKVSAVTVDAGPMLRRFRPRAQGRATKILKKTSHITVVVSA